MEKYHPNPELNLDQMVTSLAYQRVGITVNRIMESDIAARDLVHEGESEASGQVWPLESRTLGISSGEVALAVYAGGKASQQSDLVGQELGRKVDLWGHIQFQRSEHENINPLSDANAQLSGVFYLTRDGNIMLHCERTIGSDVNPEETKRCYQFAKSLGLGDFWADGCIEAASDETKKVLVQDKIDGATALELGDFLEAVISTSGDD